MNTNDTMTDLEALRAKNQELETQLDARRDADADAAIQAAISRGAIPPRATALIAKWKGMIKADPSALELLASLPANPALTPVTKPGGHVQITREDNFTILKGYMEAKTPRDKGDLYRNEIDGRITRRELLAFAPYADRLPFQASNSLGTLVSDLISQRALATLVSRRPMLSAFVTDFSDGVVKLNQTIDTRTIGLPAISDFGAAASNRGDTSYTITIDKFKQALFVLTIQELSGTGRNLVGEQGDALATSLGNYLVDSVAALINDTFTQETVVTADNYSRGTISHITGAMNVLGVPDYDRFGLVNSAVAIAMREDEVLMRNFDQNNSSGYAHWQNLDGFRDIWEYPALPANAVNLNGAFFQRNALLLAARLPANPTEISGAGFPGVMQTIQDGVSGLSVMVNRWVDPQTLSINDRLLIMFGCARGVLNDLHKTVES